MQRNSTSRRSLLTSAAAVLTGAPLATVTASAATPKLETFTFAPPMITQAEMASVRDAQRYIDRMMLSFGRRIKDGAEVEPGPIWVDVDDDANLEEWEFQETCGSTDRGIDIDWSGSPKPNWRRVREEYRKRRAAGNYAELPSDEFNQLLYSA